MTLSIEQPGVSASGRPPRATRARWDHDAEIRLLRDLWRRQEAELGPGFEPNIAYVAAHFALELTLRRRLVVLDQITPHLTGRVLEWGCQHAIDSCIYRHRLGSAVEPHGCDMVDERFFGVLHGFSGLAYRKLEHPVALPYPDAWFDVVTSNGVLEHVYDDRASLDELRRVLKPGGRLIITCLPNRWSYTEALQRALGHHAHDRLYTLAETSEMLTSRGFEVLDHGRSFVIPTMLQGFPSLLRRAFDRLHRPLLGLNAALERLWPLNLIASNLWIFARKRG